MKKFISLFTLILLLFPLGVLAKNSCLSCKGSLAAAEKGGSKSEGTSQTPSPSPSPSPSINQGQTQTEEEQRTSDIDEELGRNKPSYNPRSETARAHMSEVAKAVEQLIYISYQIENQGLGREIREIARAQNSDEDKAMQALDKAKDRGGVKKFFLGPNYKQLKEIKKVTEQNQERIKTLNRIKPQIENGKKVNLEDQIQVLEEQNNALQNQVNNLTPGFSLLGWFFKMIYKY